MTHPPRHLSPQPNRNRFSAQLLSQLIFCGVVLVSLGYILSMLPGMTTTPTNTSRTCITGGWKLALIVVHISTFALIPWAMKVFYDCLTILKHSSNQIFASQLGLSCIMIGIAAEIGWHVTQCWYYQNEFTMLNFMFYFFLISAFALWSYSLSITNTLATRVTNIISALGLLVVSLLYPLGNLSDSGSYKLSIYFVLTVVFSILTYRGYQLLQDWRIIFFPIFSVGVNLVFVFLLVRYGGSPYTDPQISANALFHILHDLAGTETGVVIFTWLFYQKGRTVRLSQLDQSTNA